MLEAASTSETLVNFYHAIRYNIPEDSHLHTCHCENLKYHHVGTAGDTEMKITKVMCLSETLVHKLFCLMDQQNSQFSEDHYVINTK
jgi:hypothetical protein